MKYSCLSCLYEWDSTARRKIMRCPVCHRRQGIEQQRFRQAVEAAKAALRKVAESPPPDNPPPLDVYKDIAQLFAPVFEVAGRTFPSPLVPVMFFGKVLEKAAQELRKTARLEAATGSANRGSKAKGKLQPP